MSRFDAAIWALKEEALGMDQCVLIGDEKEWRGQIDAAIRVLEVAGRVDKVSEGAALNVLLEGLPFFPPDNVVDAIRRIRTLLEALPQEEK